MRVSIGEFRKNMALYLDKAEKGEEVIIARRAKDMVRIVQIVQSEHAVSVQDPKCIQEALGKSKITTGGTK